MNKESRKRVTLLKIAFTSLAGVFLLCFASCGTIETTTTPTSEQSQSTDTKRPALDSTKQLAWGVVSDSSGTPLEGVLAENSYASSSSDNTGAYHIYLPAGPQTIKFSKEGYKSESSVVSGNAGTDTELKVTLASSGGSGGGTSGGGGTGSGETFTTTSGARLERRVSGSGRLEFDVTGVANDPEDKVNIAWGYEPGSRWTGGKGGSGTAEWGLRVYKLKCYAIGGTFTGEARYSYPWTVDKTVHVIVEWDTSSITTNVGGSATQIKGSFPGEWIIGIGWPPAVRPGAEGSRYTNIKWPSGSVSVN